MKITIKQQKKEGECPWAGGRGYGTTSEKQHAEGIARKATWRTVFKGQAGGCYPGEKDKTLWINQS